MIAALLAIALTNAPMSLRSPEFFAGGRLPTSMMASECGGANRPPLLLWSNAPKGSRSFALVVRDPDAPVSGGFYHWIVYDVAASDGRFGANAPIGTAHIGLASTGKAAYYGPCPPPGPAHHYVFTLYALDVVRIGGTAILTGPQLEARVRGHVLARATLEGTTSHP